MQTQKQLKNTNDSWSEEFDEQFIIAFGGKGSPDDIKAFISSTIKAREREVIEGIFIDCEEWVNEEKGWMISKKLVREYAKEKGVEI